ncbi:hypothetical protein D050_2646B, partial [Vibrio parahaemolyticus VPCR-2009]
TIHR